MGSGKVRVGVCGAGVEAGEVSVFCSCAAFCDDRVEGKTAGKIPAGIVCVADGEVGITGCVAVQPAATKVNINSRTILGITVKFFQIAILIVVIRGEVQ